MERTRLAPLVGLVGSVLVLGLLVVPYLFIQSRPGTTVGIYYAAGAVNPLVAGFFALVGIIVIAAGRERRTDPGFAAGVTLVLGLFIVVVTGLWAVTVPIGGVFDEAPPVVIQYHRWMTTATAAVIPIAGLWWARTLGLL